MKLVPPDPSYRESFIAAYKEMEDEHKEAWIYAGKRFTEEMLYADFDEYVSQLRAREHTPPDDFVCDTTLWAVEDNEVLGRIGFRHYLSQPILIRGGHIGYIVRPSSRRKGVAEFMFTEALKSQRAKDLGRVLVTCDANNVASRKLIERYGGTREELPLEEGGDPTLLRYWISIR